MQSHFNQESDKIIYKKINKDFIVQLFFLTPFIFIVSYLLRSSFAGRCDDIGCFFGAIFNGFLLIMLIIALVSFGIKITRFIKNKNLVKSYNNKLYIAYISTIGLLLLAVMTTWLLSNKAIQRPFQLMSYTQEGKKIKQRCENSGGVYELLKFREGKYEHMCYCGVSDGYRISRGKQCFSCRNDGECKARATYDIKQNVKCIDGICKQANSIDLKVKVLP